MFNYLRLTLMVLGNILHAPIWLSNIKKMSADDSIDSSYKYDYLRTMVKRINRIGRVSVSVEGVENLPEKDGYIMFPNHQGYYDSLAIIEAHPRMFGIVIKKEASGWPVVKQVLSLIHGIPINRSDIKASLDVINRMTEFVKAGGNFLIFPEGTCSPYGNKLLPMKGGSFKSAVNAKCPIVPVAQIDCFKPLDRPGISKINVKVAFLKPLYYEEYGTMKTVEIAAIVHDRIQEYIEANKG